MGEDATKIWIALIAYLLVVIVRYSTKEGWAVARMVRVLQMNVFSRKTLKQLLNPDRDKNKNNESQMRLVLWVGSCGAAVHGRPAFLSAKKCNFSVYDEFVQACAEIVQASHGSSLF